MKKKSILSLVILLAGMVGLSTSCSDMLTPDLERYVEKNAGDSIYSYLGILKSMQKIVERDVILGEARGDLVAATTYTSDSVSHIFNFDDQRDGDNAFLQCADYYNIINQCNFYLHYVDTADVKDEVKYMQKEWAQVQAMRAWTYLQLVQNYGSVPFFTEPVSSSSVGKEIVKSGKVINKDNIADLLVAAGLDRAYELQEQFGFPSYGTYYNGSVNIPSNSCFFPVGLVTADLYLMQNDYDKAADMYYKYMRMKAPYVPNQSMGFSEIISQEGTRYIPSMGGWSSRFTSYSTGNQGSNDEPNGNELITIIPGAASKSQGDVLIQVQNIYGFQTSSQTLGTNGGSISVSPKEEYRQLEPSENYAGLNAAQVYCNYRTSGGTEVQEFYDGVGDARFNGSAPLRRIDGEDFRFIAKRTPLSNLVFDWQSRRVYGSGYNSYYAIPVYRKALVHLRFAEAINRAGFPEHAFSVLKDGTMSDNYPTLRYKDSINYNIQVDSTDLENIKIDTISVDTIKNIPYLLKPEANAGGAYYISLNEMLNAQSKSYLNFADSKFNNSATNYTGIHGLGCGETRGYRDSLYTYDLCVAQKIAAARADKDGQTSEWETTLCDSLNRVGIEQAVKDGTITQDEVITAVEDLIIDELALETAFEGNRYYDLLRFANHKGNGAIDNEWLAKKIASRGMAPRTGYDAALYGRLVGGTRWYLALPEDK